VEGSRLIRCTTIYPVYCRVRHDVEHAITGN